MISNQIKFGTDGWRAIIGREYTQTNVARLSEAVAKWAKANQKQTKIAIAVSYTHLTLPTKA